MPRLDCISILEAGSFGSDSGTVVIPTGEVPFPITGFSVFSSSGASIVAFVGSTSVGGLFTEAGSSTVSWVGTSTGGAGAERDVMGLRSFLNLFGSRQAMTSDGMVDGA